MLSVKDAPSFIKYRKNFNKYFIARIMREIYYFIYIYIFIYLFIHFIYIFIYLYILFIPNSGINKRNIADMLVNIKINMKIIDCRTRHSVKTTCLNTFIRFKCYFNQHWIWTTLSIKIFQVSFFPKR